MLIDIKLCSITTGDLFKHVLLDWSLPPDYADCLERHYLINWSRDWFTSQTGKGGIYHQGVFYSMIFAPKQTISDVINSPRIALSFRKLYSCSYGYVMVRGLKNTGSNQL